MVLSESISGGWRRHVESERDDHRPTDLRLSELIDDPSEAAESGRAPARGTLGWVKTAAALGAVGCVVVVAGFVLGPSTWLETTDRDDDPPPASTERNLDAGGSLVADGTDDVDAPTPAEQVASVPTLAAGFDDGSRPTIGGEGDAALDDEKAPADYGSNLAMIRSASVRNRNHDDSTHRDTPQSQLVLVDHFGPRSDYLTSPGGNPERSFPVLGGGQFRASCEFSHFAYDDPLVHPGQPGASHLHMFFGNTDVNAFTTYDTLINSGSSTCNGQELNRTGYWVPAMFDGEGNVRVPERITIYYKGEGNARGNSEVYPAGAALIASENLNTSPIAEGGLGGEKLTFVCSDNFSTNTGDGSQTIPACDGSAHAGPGQWTVLEMNVKFPQCWNGQDPSDWNNFHPPNGNWYGSNCTGQYNRTLPNMEFFVNYRIDPGENTANWFLASDVDPTSFGARKGTGGATTHGDWWGGWHPEVNRMWIDNCVNYRTDVPSGCGKGYLTNGGPDGTAPYDGPALQLRPQYGGPYKIAAKTLLAELCPEPRQAYSKPEDAAYCEPA
jgi:hypothetical protein